MALLFLVFAGSARADLLHAGELSPTLGGWIENPGASPNVTAFGVAADPETGEAGWEIDDPTGVVGSTWFYSAPEDELPGSEDSWSFSTRFRIVNPADLADGIVLEVTRPRAGSPPTQSFRLALGASLRGDTLIESEDGLSFEAPRRAFGETGYVDLEIAYDASDGSADLLIDDLLVHSDWHPTTSFVDESRIVWGAGSSAETGRVRFAAARFWIGTPACRDGIDNDGDGLIDYAPRGGDSGCASAKDGNEFVPDTDGDGLHDAFESAYGFAVEDADEDGNGVADGEDDFDGDGLDNETEAFDRLDPTEIDTDGDALEDGFEILYGFDPRHPGEAFLDPDGDGRDNLAEQGAGTHPLVADASSRHWILDGDTGTIWIDGMLQMAIDGVPYASTRVEGVREFRFAGSLSIPAGDHITGRGPDPIRLYAGDDLLVGRGAFFDFAATGVLPGPGGGLGGLGGDGQAGGAGGPGGQGGSGGIRGPGGVAVGIPFLLCETSNGFRGSRGRIGERGGAGAPGADGAEGAPGGLGFAASANSFATGGEGGTGGVEGLGGIGQDSEGNGGSGGRSPSTAFELASAGENGSGGTVGRSSSPPVRIPGDPGGVFRPPRPARELAEAGFAGAGGRNDVVPDQRLTGGGGGAGGGAGGSGGGAGGGGGGQGGGGGGGGGASAILCGDGNDGGHGGVGGRGAPGGAGGQGGDGGRGGAGGGAIELRARGRLVVRGALDVRGGAGLPGESGGSPGQPGSYTSGLSGAAGETAAAYEDGGDGGRGGRGGYGAMGSPGAAGGPGGAGSGGTVLVQSSVLDTSEIEVIAFGGVGNGGTGRYVRASNSPLSEGETYHGATRQAYIGIREFNPFVRFNGYPVKTPLVAGLLGGAEAFGVVPAASVESDELDEVRDLAPPDAGGAIVRLPFSHLIRDTDRYQGFEMLAWMPLAGDVVSPTLQYAMGSLGTLADPDRLQVGGTLRAAEFGGAGFESLDRLAADELYLTLVPQGITEAFVTAGAIGMAGEGTLRSGEVLYLPEPAALPGLLLGGMALALRAARRESIRASPPRSDSVSGSSSV